MVPIREPKTYSILLADDLTLVREGLARCVRRSLSFASSDSVPKGCRIADDGA